MAVMGMEPNYDQLSHDASPAAGSIWGWFTALAVLAGLALSVDAIFASSATYDEVAYLKIGAKWWRTGDQSTITRMGSPLTFWKLQQVPVLWLVDHLGRREWIDEPIVHQRQLLPVVRLGCLWIWLVAIALTAAWSRQSHGPRAMALAAWLFALSPNLIAHGTLATMELPLVAAATAMFWFFWRFLDRRRWPWFWASAVAAGLAFSCKFTAIVFPPIVAVVWWMARWQSGERRPLRLTWHVLSHTLAFVSLMLLTNFALTGFARMPLSTTEGKHPSLDKWLGAETAQEVARLYETPLPQDWVGFATQMHHQASGGASYLWGERRIKGWWYYYFVALAVKVPLGFWLLVVARLALVPASTHRPGERHTSPLAKGGPGGVSSMRGKENNSTKSHIHLLPLVFLLFLTITAIGSSRNYGMRYLLPLAPLAIVWVSALAEGRRTAWPRIAAALGLIGLVAAVTASHPYELTYFNILAGGPEGGRHILSDSNLDWGQGLDTLVRLQRERPEFRNLTLYYFGDTEPAYYGVAGRCYVINAVDDQSNVPGLGAVTTPYLGVSASLQFGPWGPPGFFRDLGRLEPVRLTDDTTIAIYRTADLRDANFLMGSEVRGSVPPGFQARTEPRPTEVAELGVGLMTPPSTRLEVCPARTEPRPPEDHTAVRQ
jgi:4-amino-4-deoxy-L-arabinose transferase-like glycosyltransferase